LQVFVRGAQAADCGAATLPQQEKNTHLICSGNK
jgi:hypothetical protein